MSKDMEPHYVVTKSQVWHSFWYGVIFGAALVTAGYYVSPVAFDAASLLDRSVAAKPEQAKKQSH